MRGEETSCTDIWRKYEAGREHHRIQNLYRQTERCHRFYEGDQWHGCKSGGEELPILNFIRPICKYKIATVAMNDTAIIYTAIDGDPQAAQLCKLLTEYAAGQWEQGKMDSRKWEIIKNACITGDHYLYCFDERQPSEAVVVDMEPRLKMRPVGRTAIYFADEQNPEISEQEWIIIAERRPVEQVRKEAKKNGIDEVELARIISDEVDDTQIGYSDADEVDTDLGKCTSLLYMRMTEEGVSFARSTQAVVYQPEQTIPGLDVYPVAGMRWDAKEGSARGVGVVEPLIPNQIEVNRTIARRAICVKRYSFPTAVYDANAVQNPNDLGKVGASLKVQNLQGRSLSSMVQYLTPVAIGGDATLLQNELVSMSRELEGASDAATGQVDPTKTSGEAIKAARDQSAMSLNEQTAAYKQFVEDVARIWYKLWVVYSPGGMMIPIEQDGVVQDVMIDASMLSEMDVNIRIDVSPIDPYSVLAREMSLENALAAGHITFEEYVDALDENSGVPKDKFNAILENRKTQQNAQLQAQIGGVMVDDTITNLAQNQPVATATGGTQNAMPVM